MGRQKESEVQAAQDAADAGKREIQQRAAAEAGAIKANADRELASAKQQEAMAAAKGKQEVKEKLASKFENVNTKLAAEKKSTQREAISDLDSAFRKSQEVTNMIAAMKQKYEILAAQDVPSIKDQVPGLKRKAAQQAMQEN